MNINKLKAPESEGDVTSHWKYIDKIYVSCICITYNHENYISDTLNAMLAQKSDYRFEIIVHDDNSTDKTKDILLGYKKKYPSIIRLILQEENQYSQGKKATSIIFPICKGEFIAFCEGDDYWVDENKISIQTKYLLNNPNVFISSCDAFIIDCKGNKITNSKLPKRYRRDFTAEELVLGKAWLLTLNWMFRRIDVSAIHELGKVKNGDTFITSIFGLYGGSHHHEDIKPSAYRSHLGGVWSLLSENEKEDSKINTFFWMYQYYLRIGEARYASEYWKKYLGLIVQKITTLDLIYLLTSYSFIALKRLAKKCLRVIGVSFKG